jgi:hypothetical protein
MQPLKWRLTWKRLEGKPSRVVLLNFWGHTNTLVSFRRVSEYPKITEKFHTLQKDEMALRMQ